MVAVDRAEHIIRFHDSFPGRAHSEDDEWKIREEVVALLGIVGEASPEKWVWISETVSAHNICI